MENTVYWKQGDVTEKVTFIPRNRGLYQWLVAGFIYSFCAGASFQWLVSPHTYHDPPILAKKIGSHLTYNVIVVFVLLPFAYNIMQFLSNTIVLYSTMMAVVVSLSHHDAVYYRPQGPKLFVVLSMKRNLIKTFQI